ncbi:MAG: PHP domain-containing protein [Spirochaetaceae bacterium]|jgi:predicted metal-dependent phosphoesterase TrpH|nr:PHP domain-containing protein [Spirochaetaceae bacterium]
MIDLHTHSSASDGNLSPAELVRAAHAAGVSTIALTDHDTIDGIPEAESEATRLGISLIPGTEIDINWQYDAADAKAGIVRSSREFHLLGLGLKAPSPAFTGLMAEIKMERKRRNLLMIDKMNEAGVDADYRELCGMAGGGCVGRPHFAQYLIKLGKARSMQAAFDGFLGKGKPFYIQKTGADFRRAADAIHESGGLAVLAHPTTLYVSWGRLPVILAGLKEQGLDGVEAWHPVATERVCRRLEALAGTLGLRVTAGSDFHGEKRPGRRLGYTGGGLPIDDSFLARAGLAAD